MVTMKHFGIMKRLILLIMGVSALMMAGCNKEIAAPQEEAAHHLTIDITVNLDTPGTRVVKQDWEAGDRIYVFFDFTPDTEAVEYMTMTYDGGFWNYVFSNNQMENALLQKGQGSLYAVYFPFGTPSFDAQAVTESLLRQIRFNSPEITSGRSSYSYCFGAPYTIDSRGILSATLDMAIGSSLVQFYVPGIDAADADNYLFSCTYVKAASVYSLACRKRNGAIEYSVYYTTGSRDIPGNYYQGGMVFTGYHDPAIEAKGNYIQYDVTVTDTKGTASIADDEKYNLIIPNELLHSHDAVELPPLDSDRWSPGNFKNGHEYVDMGNGLCFATMNLGATSPEDPGWYLCYGRTSPDSDKSDFYHDSATELWGGNWRVPTRWEWEPLLNTENYTWTEDSTNNTWIVTSHENGNQLVLPKTDGAYWSSTWDTLFGVHLTFIVMTSPNPSSEINSYEDIARLVRPILY